MKNFDEKNIKDWLREIEKRDPATIQLGLERMRQVIPDNFFECPVVTIAGTNGKGSTLTALAKLLEKSKKKIGTYTSPHLIHFNERIRINGVPVSNHQLCEAFVVARSLSEGIPLTYFEFTTLTAFIIFQEAKLDCLILEVGMGGRLDAVNVIAPDLAIITALSQDHEAWLGHTLSEIAREKAGILRSAIPVILSHEATDPVVLEKTREGHNAVYIEKIHFDYFPGNQQWEDKLAEKLIKVPVNYLPPNSVSLAMAAYTVLRDKWPELPAVAEAVESLENKGMVGRFHRMDLNKKHFIFDVAHNPGGAAWLATRLKQRSKQGRYLAVWSSLADKRHEAFIAPLKEIIDKWYVCSVEGTSRAVSEKVLTKRLKDQGITAVKCFKTVEAAIVSVSEEVDQDDEIIVLGSFLVVGQAYSALRQDFITLADFGLYNA